MLLLLAVVLALALWKKDSLALLSVLAGAAGARAGSSCS
jgi:hypothetical protein